MQTREEREQELNEALERAKDASDRIRDISYWMDVKDVENSRSKILLLQEHISRLGSELDKRIRELNTRNRLFNN